MQNAYFLLIVWIPYACFSMSWLYQKMDSYSDVMGVATLHYQDEARNRPITVEVWYPTENNTSPPEVVQDQIWVHPQEVRNVNIAKRETPYPLIIMSHGHKGDRRERSWLADLLVHQGFVVASVEHFGSAWRHYTPLATFLFWERAKDVSFVIDELLKNSFLKENLDAERIGFVGYSLGGMTGLALAGAKAQNAKFIAKKYQSEVAEIPVEQIDQIDFSAAELDYFNPKIKSMLLICPATFVYPTDSFSTIKIPVGLIASVDDEVLPFEDHASRLAKYLSLYKIKLMKNKVSHYAFSNCLNEAGIKLFQQTAKVIPGSWDWRSIHKEAGKFAVQFFEETLKK